MSDSIARYRFESWQRQGIGNATISNGGARPQIGLKIELAAINRGKSSANRLFQIVGPGDIIGFNADMVIRTEPVNWNTNFPPNLFAHIELYDEDFPWRYSPESSDDQNNLCPWIFLIVLKESEFEFEEDPQNNIPLPRIKNIVTSNLPPVEEAYLWAHVQKIEVSTIPSDNNPDRIISRLVCPRKLEPNTAYYAFVVPTYEAGRRAGLGQSEPEIFKSTTTEIIDSTTKAKGDTFPFFYKWYFHTGNDMDFEYLASLLVPRQTDPLVGRKKMDCSRPGFGIPDSIAATGFTVYLETALRSPSASSLDPVDTTQLQHFENAIKLQLNLPQIINSVPVVTPPFYGQKHLFERSLDPSKETWIHQLNRDPANRAAAGLGVQVLRRYQDQYMKKAWEQVETIVEANKTINSAVGTLAICNAMYAKNFKPLLDPINLANTKFAGMALLAPVFVKIKGINKKGEPGTLHNLLQKSCQNTSMYTAAFRKITRKRGTICKKLEKNEGKIDFDKLLFQQQQDNFLEVKNIEKQFVKLREIHFENIPDLSKENKEAIDKFFQDLIDLTNIENECVNISDWRSIDPNITIPNLLRNRVTMPVAGWFDNPDDIKPALAYPDFEEPMYLKLKEISSEFLISNLHLIPNNTITLLESNQAFIESFMVGLNVEMGREMLWREFPTDERSSCFRQFWDLKGVKNFDGMDEQEKVRKTEEFKDITPIHTWKKPKYEDSKNGLSDHNNRPMKSEENHLVLALRGDLLKCFPNTSIYAVKAKKQGGKYYIDPNQDILFPAFKAEVGEDVKFLGFDLTIGKAKGSDTETDPGWFFIVQETPGETRFGMDKNAPVINEEKKEMTWDDISWTMFPKEIDFIEVNTGPTFTPPVNPDGTSTLEWPPDKTSWAKSSADMANILYQKPVKIAIHATEMLKGIAIT